MSATRRHDFVALGGPCRLWLRDVPAARAARAFAVAEAEVRRIEAKYSRYRADSVLSRLNAAAGQGPQAVDAETRGLLEFGLQLQRQSAGAFALNAGAFRRLWNWQRPRPPAATAVAELARALRAEGPALDAQGGLLLPAGQEVDFGGFGKEYAVDRAHALLRAHGGESALVDLGGDLRASLAPEAPAQQAWRVGIADPRAPDRACLRLALRSGALCTSGDYQRGYWHRGRRYHHLLDARSGWPVQGGPRGISVLGDDAMSCGGMATLGMLHGAEATPWLGDLPWPWLAVDAGGGLHGPLAGNAEAGGLDPGLAHGEVICA